MNIFRMQCFLSVAKHRSITKAAIEMMITQPAMSSQMVQLEKELGSKLMQKEKNGIHLTYQGKYVFRQFESILKIYDETINMLSRAENPHLYVGYHGPANWANINELFTKFKNENENLDLQITTGDQNILIEKLLSRKVDLIFIDKQELDGMGNIKYEYLFKDFSATGFAPTHPFASKKSVTIDELNQEHIIMRNNKSATRSLATINRRIISSGLDMSNAEFVEEYETTIAIASTGYGVTLVPRSFKQVGSILNYVNIECETMYVDYCIAYRNDMDNPAIQQFIKLCHERDWQQV